MTGVGSPGTAHVSISADGPIPYLSSSSAVHSTPSGVRLSDVSVTDTNWERCVPGDEDRLSTWFRRAVFESPRTAIVVHECCWKLLCEQFKPGELCLDTLFEVCQDLPWQSGVLEIGQSVLILLKISHHAHPVRAI